jgi:hypothetical protein
MFGSDESADEASDNDTDEGFRSNDDDDDWEGDKSNDFGFDDEPTKPRKDSHLPTTGKNGGLRSKSPAPGRNGGSLRSKSPAPGRNGGSLRSKSPAPGRNGGSLRSKSPAPGRHGGSLRSKSPAPGGRATNLRAKSPGPGGLRRGASGTGSTKRRLPPAPPARGKGGKDKEVRFNLDSEHRNAGNGFSWADDAEKEYGPVTQRRNRRIRKSNDDWD